MRKAMILGALLVMAGGSVQANDPGGGTPGVLIKNEDIKKCVGHTENTTNGPMPSTFPIQHLVDCAEKEIQLEKWHFEPNGKISIGPNKCLGVWNLAYNGTIFWPTITDQCSAIYTTWEKYVPWPHTPENPPVKFKLRNATLKTCLGVIEQKSEYPVVVLVHCEDELYTVWRQE